MSWTFLQGGRGGIVSNTYTGYLNSLNLQEMILELTVYMTGWSDGASYCVASKFPTQIDLITSFALELAKPKKICVLLKT